MGGFQDAALKADAAAAVEKPSICDGLMTRTLCTHWEKS